MRKILGYLPAAGFTVYYLYAGLLTGAGMQLPMVLLWLACFWASAFLLHKGLFWGGVFGLIPAVHMIYTSTRHTAYIHLTLGIALILFYVGFGIYLWKKRNDIPKTKNREILVIGTKVALTAAVLLVSAYAAVIGALILTSEGLHPVLVGIGAFVIPSLFLPLIWLKKRKKFFLIWLIPAAVFFLALGIDYAMVRYDKSITVNTSPNINVREYLPFAEDTKIVKHESETLKLTEDLPRIDGAAALFPVYSAFVHAVYPETTELHNGVFEYNNTPHGYQLLAERKTDIFIGVYPSEEQKAYAEENGTTFRYTPIGSEGFVFFVHKDNPIDGLTAEQIRGIYSGEITNWKQVGGRDEKIAAFQRNEGSGSQSMLQRFMGDTPIMEAPTELRNDLMSGIIEQVSNYKSKSNSIGFSFRYYVEGIIKNPDIKMISVDGAAPTAENIKNGTYPIVTPIYAVTYEEQTNENVGRLLDWILSEEGQRIIEETGYVGFEQRFIR
ncbi:MAG: substrate-binding domain-containing protein [Oscillospiraceae bacterium]|nr:substrate-binding domain-containing protein [Oscillospiraceae bacterium]